MVASRRAIAKLEGVESYTRSEQVGAKVKLVNFSRAIDECAFLSDESLFR